MLVELELARARLALRGAIAAAIRRQCNVEWTGKGGYRPLAKLRKTKMDSVRVPREAIAIQVLRRDHRHKVVVIEFTDAQNKLRTATVPEIALVRYARRRERKYE
jgi:hypothetical protein